MWCNVIIVPVFCEGKICWYQEISGPLKDISIPKKCVSSKSMEQYKLILLYHLWTFSVGKLIIDEFLKTFMF